MAAQTSQDDLGKPCLELQVALNKQLPPEDPPQDAAREQDHYAEDVEDDAHNRRKGRCGCAGRGLLEKLIGLNAWCKVTVLRLKSCGLGEGGGRALLEGLRVNTTVTSLNLGGNGLREGGGRALAETLRLNITVKSLNFHANDLREEVRSALGQAWNESNGGGMGRVIRVDLFLQKVRWGQKLDCRHSRNAGMRGKAPRRSSNSLKH